MSRSLSRRSAASAVALLAIVPAAPLWAAEPPQLTTEDEIAIRGTILAWNPDTRMMVLESPERDTLAYRVVPTMRPSGQNVLDMLKPGMQVDVRYYRIVDFLVAKTTPQVTARAKALLAETAEAPGLAGTNQRVKLWHVDGMVVRVDLAAKKIEIVEPNGGMIYRTPWIKRPAGQAVLKELKPGDLVTLVFSERTIFEIKPVY
jgi:hypothetical protein